MHGELASFGAEQISGDSHVIAEIKQFVKLETVFADGIFFHVNLEPLPILLQMREASFSHQANRHNPPGHAHVCLGIFQLLFGFR